MNNYYNYCKASFIDQSLLLQNTVRKCEKVQTGKDDRPLDRVEIYDSGTLPLRKPYLVAMADAVEDELENNIGDIADEIDEDYEDGEEQYEDNADNKEEL